MAKPGARSRLACREPWSFPPYGVPVLGGAVTGTDYAHSMNGTREADSGPPQHWQAPVAAGPVRASVRLPGSKSMTNRALVLAALADGPGMITNPLRARDTLLMAGALTALGASVQDSPAGWRGSPGRTTTDARGNVGDAGTVMRFVPPAAALTATTVEIRGGAGASMATVGPISDGLRAVGAVIYAEGRGAVPCSVPSSRGLAGGFITVD